VKPGGRLVYATCSLLPEENEAIVEAFLAANEGFAQLNAQEVLAKQGIVVECGEQLRLTPAGPRHRRLLCRRAGAQGLMPAARRLLAGLAAGPGGPGRGGGAPRADGHVLRHRPVEVAFSPWNDPEAALLKAIDEAREQILVQAYLFTSKPLARASVEAHRRGVRVEVMLDAESNRPHPPACCRLAWLPACTGGGRDPLQHRPQQGDDLRPGNGAHGAVATGSYNFTRSARVANAENLLILRGNPALVRAYLGNWQRHKAEAPWLRSLDDCPRRKRKKDGRETDRHLLIELWRRHPEAGHFLAGGRAVRCACSMAGLIPVRSKRCCTGAARPTSNMQRGAGEEGLRRVVFPLTALLPRADWPAHSSNWHHVNLLQAGGAAAAGDGGDPPDRACPQAGLSQAGWLASFERFFAFGAWVVVALHIIGVLPAVIDGLEQISFTIGKAKRQSVDAAPGRADGDGDGAHRPVAGRRGRKPADAHRGPRSPTSSWFLRGSPRPC
jgi:hypothetical protein